MLSFKGTSSLMTERAGRRDGLWKQDPNGEYRDLPTGNETERLNRPGSNGLLSYQRHWRDLTGHLSATSVIESK